MRKGQGRAGKPKDGRGNLGPGRRLSQKENWNLFVEDRVYIEGFKVRGQAKRRSWREARKGGRKNGVTEGCLA